MCDEIDQLTDRAAQEAEFASLARAIEAAWKASQPHPAACVDCDEPIPALRQQMFCIRCVDCQNLFERKERLFSRRL